MFKRINDMQKKPSRYNSRLLSPKSYPAFNKMIKSYKYDERKTIHGNDEHIRLETIGRAVEFFYRVIKNS